MLVLRCRCHALLSAPFIEKASSVWLHDMKKQFPAKSKSGRIFRVKMNILKGTNVYHDLSTPVMAWNMAENTVVDCKILATFLVTGLSRVHSQETRAVFSRDGGTGRAHKWSDMLMLSHRHALLRTCTRHA